MYTATLASVRTVMRCNAAAILLAERDGACLCVFVVPSIYMLVAKTRRPALSNDEDADSEISEPTEAVA